MNSKLSLSTMRHLLLALIISTSLLACNGRQQAAASAENSGANLVKNVLGSFVGAFGENKIRILITKAQAGIIEGRSIVGGNDRPFKGTISEKDGIFQIEAREPGDDPNDGVFKFEFARNSPNTLEGSWE